MDQTKKFLVVHRYTMVLYEKYENLILFELMKTRPSSDTCHAYNELMMQLTNSSIKASKHILDNEISEHYLQIIKRNGIKYEKVPPKIHQRNVVEKAISMFKDHFKQPWWGLTTHYKCIYATTCYPRLKTH